VQGLENLKNLNLLYAEDDKIIAEQYINIFNQFFKKVYHAPNGFEALKIYDANLIHIVIADIKMPIMSGLELIAELRNKGDEVPALITSSYNEKEYLHQAIKLRLVDYLVKPATYTTIKETLKRCLDELEKKEVFSTIITQECTYSKLTKKLTCKDEEYLLQNKESLLLELFLKHRKQLLKKETIEYEVYSDSVLSEGGLKNLILKLRKKIGHDKIVTIKNSGYILL
jgi:YesN/AraC family two-component response regulator